MANVMNTETLEQLQNTMRVNPKQSRQRTYEGWNFNSGNYLFTTDTK